MTADSKVKVSTPPILIGHLPIAEREARKAFTEIQNNTYENKSLGKQKQTEDALPCDCTFDPANDEVTPYTACGERADCINRLTQTECLESECRSRSHCQNQRFQRKQYAQLDIVQTEKKGFGLRAAANLERQVSLAHFLATFIDVTRSSNFFRAIRNDFIYEYIGEVVTEHTLLKRMRAYNDEGIEHFYFMMLQKGQFIDATKRGGIGRFANHSCNPNCYVAKWYVGNRIRMGIFAKRRILKDEELTFNYNVDRYGHDAQKCHCGEPNCVGFIGGKTQTEVATMDDVYIEALGLDDDQIRSLSINVPKKSKKGKKVTLEEEEELDFDLKELQVHEVPALVNAIRKAIGNTRPILMKLLSRIQMTEDPPTLRNLLRLRGLGLMADILEEYTDDIEMATLILSAVNTWPLVNRIKIEDVGFEDKIRPYTSSEDEELNSLSQEILQRWSTLEQGYRIPRRKLEDDDVPTITHITLDDDSDRPKKRARLTEIEIPLDLPPPAPVPTSATSYRRTSSQISWETTPVTPRAPTLPREPTKDQLDAIIARAAATAAAMAAAAAPTPASPVKEKSKPRSSANKEKSEQARAAAKEKQLQKLIGSVVVKAASKYAKAMGKDTFKKYAEECTVAIAEKEKKAPSYATVKLDKLSDEKQHKIKKYTKDFFTKAMHKIEKKKAARASASGSHSNPPSPTVDPRRAQPPGSRSASSKSASSSDTMVVSVQATPLSSSGGSGGDDGESLVEDLNIDDFMGQMFGDDPKLEEIDDETLKNEQTPDCDLDGDQLIPTASAHNTPVEDVDDTDDKYLRDRHGVNVEEASLAAAF